MKTDPNTYSALGEVAAVNERRTFWARIVMDLRKAPLTARFGMIIILCYALVAIFAPVLAPYGEAEVFPEPYAPWGSVYIFGTDQTFFICQSMYEMGQIKKRMEAYEEV